MLRRDILEKPESLIVGDGERRAGIARGVTIGDSKMSLNRGENGLLESIIMLHSLYTSSGTCPVLTALKSEFTKVNAFFNSMLILTRPSQPVKSINSGIIGLSLTIT
jgi:hypothetical protein